MPYLAMLENIFLKSLRFAPRSRWLTKFNTVLRRPNTHLWYKFHEDPSQSVWSERKTERSGPKIGWSGAERVWQKMMERERSGSGTRSGRSRSGNGAESGGYRNRLERGAAFSPLTLRSHALISAVKLITDRRTERKTNRRRVNRTLAGGGDYDMTTACVEHTVCSILACWMCYTRYVLFAIQHFKFLSFLYSCFLMT